MNDADYRDRCIVQLRCVIADREAELNRLQGELAELLAAAGRRPGDGSDQPELFSTAPLDLFADLQ